MLRSFASTANRSFQIAGRRSLSTTSHLVVNAVGADRPGIVSEVTKHVVEAGGNVGESQAAKLGTHFSLMMILTCPNDKVGPLTEAVLALEGMNSSIFETEAPATGLATPAVGYSGIVTLSGADQPGILHKVTHVMAKMGLSIEKLKTGEDIAPHGGTTLFCMTAIANAHEPLAKDFDVNKIQRTLESLGDSMNCDITLDEVQDDSIGASFFGN